MFDWKLSSSLTCLFWISKSFFKFHFHPSSRKWHKLRVQFFRCRRSSKIFYLVVERCQSPVTTYQRFSPFWTWYIRGDNEVWKGQIYLFRNVLLLLFFHKKFRIIFWNWAGKARSTNRTRDLQKEQCIRPEWYSFFKWAHLLPCTLSEVVFEMPFETNYSISERYFFFTR